MTAPLPLPLKDALIEKLAESMTLALPGLTPRRVYGATGLPGKATAVVGMRRAGKTTFLHQLRGEQLAQGKPQTQLPYVNFEDERLAGLDASQLGFLLDEHARRVPDVTGGVLWCFDEIQVLPGWERFVRRLLDTGRDEVIVTGSSAALLSSEIATALRGRAWTVPLYPFGFAEVLRHRGAEVPQDPAFLSAAARARIERALLDWLDTGGFPEVLDLGVAARRRILQDYVDVAMLRDVMERHGTSNVIGLRWLVRHLLGNAGALFSVEKFYATLKSQGVAISKDTLHQLLAHLEDCFLVRLVWMESSSERQRMANPRKAYPVDTGLIPVFDRSGKANVGHALETAVLIELERRHCAVTYVRTAPGYEVDFLARGPTGEVELIQVCADASDPATAERELRALQAAGTIHIGAVQRLLTLTRDGAPAAAPPQVVVQAAYEWLLTPPSDN